MWSASALAEHAGVAVLDQRGGAALGDGDDRQAARPGLDDHLAVGVGARAEEEEVGAGIGARQLLALEPAEEGRALAELRAQLLLLGAAAGEQQVQPRVDGVGAEEALGEQVDPLLAGQPAGVEDLELARGRRRGRPCRGRSWRRRRPAPSGRSGPGRRRARSASGRRRGSARGRPRAPR